MLLFCFGQPLYPLPLPILQDDPEACCLLQEGTTSWSKKDGRAERDESQSESEDDAMTDSDDESLPGSEGGSSVAPADEVCVELSCLYCLSSCCINAISCIELHTNNMFDLFQHINAVSVHLEQLMRHT